MKIKVRNLSHHFINNGEVVHVLDNLNFAVKEGEFLCIVGPSGCGKSTLLDLIAGHLKPQEGEIIVDGEVITSPGVDRIPVFQEHGLFPWLNVEENIAFGLKFFGSPPKDEREIIKEMVELIGLQGFEKAYPHQLSGGMKQRVALARALAPDPEILLMDEPFGSLDALTRSELHHEIQRIHEETNKTILFVTHDLMEASLLGDRVILLSHRPSHIKKEVKIDLKRPRFKHHSKVISIAHQMEEYLKPKP